MKLLQCSDISSILSDTVICCCYRHSNSFLNGSWNAYATHHSGACYGFTPSLNCNEKNALETPNSWKNIIIIIVYVLCYLSTGCHVYFLSRACNKVVTYFLFCMVGRLISKYVFMGIILPRLLIDMLLFLACNYCCAYYTEQFWILIFQHPQKCWTISEYYKKLHDSSISLCLIVTLHAPNCGILELLYVHSITILLIYLFQYVIGVLGNSICIHIDRHHCLCIL